MPFDRLVLAPGAVSSSFDVPGVDEHAFPLKSITDAVAIRTHILKQFEAADVDPHAEQPGRLTFVIVGGGPTGVEMAGALMELFQMVLAKDFPRPRPRRGAGRPRRGARPAHRRHASLARRARSAHARGAGRGGAARADGRGGGCRDGPPRRRDGDPDAHPGVGGRRAPAPPRRRPRAAGRRERARACRARPARRGPARRVRHRRRRGRTRPAGSPLSAAGTRRDAAGPPRRPRDHPQPGRPPAPPVPLLRQGLRWRRSGATPPSPSCRSGCASGASSPGSCGSACTSCTSSASATARACCSPGRGTTSPTTAAPA